MATDQSQREQSRVNGLSGRNAKKIRKGTVLIQLYTVQYMYFQVQLNIIFQAAEAVLSTEDEDTPSPSPKLLMAQPLPPIPPTTVNTVKDMERWLYNDPRGELQGLFTCLLF